MTTKLPKAPKMSLALIGPGIVLVAMGLGSGEFILWPYLVAQFGFGVIWGALVGITLQYFASNEAGRYTIATGGSVYTAFHKLNKWIPYWFIISTFASFAWPGIIGSAGNLVSYLFESVDERVATIALLLIIGLLLTFGGTVYSSLERVQKLFVGLSIPILIVIAALISDGQTIQTLAEGFVGIGDGYNFFPSNISIMAFLGAVAYSGAGGNLVISNTFYLQDEGYGMAGNMSTQISKDSQEKKVPIGVEFVEDEENISSFKKWFRISILEQLFSFWFLGLLTIILLTIISFELAYPFDGAEGISFVFNQAEGLSSRFSSIVGTFFVLIGIVFLFTTQLGVFETTSRIMTENLQLISKNVTKKYKRKNIYFSFLWGQIAAASAITMTGIKEPIEILLIGTFFSAVSMLVLSALVLILNNSYLLPKSIRPGRFRTATLFTSVLFFSLFVALTVMEIISP